MIGVVFGIGKEWAEAARVTAMRMESLTGLPCRVIEEDPFDLESPAWLKLRVFDLIEPEVQEVLVFDADLLPLRPWDPRTLYEQTDRPFIAVPDVDSVAVMNECVGFGVPWPGQYINSGLFIAGRQHDAMLQRAFGRQPRFGNWQEQTSLNVAIFETRTEVLRLPRTFNTLLWPNGDDMRPEALRARPEITLHAASLFGDVARLREIQEGVFGPPGDDPSP